MALIASMADIFRNGVDIAALIEDADANRTRCWI